MCEPYDWHSTFGGSCLYEQWLAEALAIANENCETIASHIDHMVLGSLVDLMAGLQLSPGGDNLE